MRWAENEESGWCEKHLEAYVNIAGPVLGVPKAVTACLSGQPTQLHCHMLHLFLGLLCFTVSQQSKLAAHALNALHALFMCAQGNSCYGQQA